MADDWKPGDIAFCVREEDEQGGSEPWEVTKGCFYTVVDAFTVFNSFDQKHWLVLQLAEDPHQEAGYGWAAEWFRKVTPEAEDAFDREVIAHMAGQEVESA